MSTATILSLTLKPTVDGTEIIEISENGTGTFRTTLSAIVANYQLLSEKGAVNGYAGLDASQELLLTNFPTGAGLQILRRNAGNTALEFATISTGGITSINGDTTAAQILAGTTNRISLVDVGDTHTFDIDAAYVGQSSITTLGTITTGVWNGTDIVFSNIQDIATSRFLGRVTAATGVIEELTGTQATTLLDVFTTSLQGLVPASGGSATEFLSADGTFKVPAGGGDMVLADVQTVTGAKTFLDTTFFLRNVANTFSASFVNTITANRIYTLPDLAGTIALTSDLTGFFDTAGTGLTSSGTTVNVIGTASRITANANDIDIASDYVGQTSITTLGTIATGTWQGTTIAVNQGGTGVTTSTGTTNVVLSNSPTIVTPTIASTGWTNANHAHLAANSGGTITKAAISDFAHALLSTSHSDTLTGTVVRGDVIIGNSTPAWSRLVKGTADQVLTMDGTGTDVIWAAAASGFTDPMTTRGDIIIRNASNVTDRLAIGANTFVLTSDGTDISWASASAASQTPWAQDIDAATFALTWAGVDAAAPAGTVEYFTNLSTGLVSNVATGLIHDWKVNNVSQMTISVSTIDFKSNTLTDILDITSITSLNGVAIGNYATTTNTITMSNKTLTTPTIASFVNSVHNHQAAAGGGTLVATLALTATGTKDSTTFLRGDDTWAVPAGGSGITTLNTLTATTQTFAVAQADELGISSVTSTHTFSVGANIPRKDEVNVFTANQDFDGNNLIMDVDGDTTFGEITDDVIQLTTPIATVGAGLHIGNTTGHIELINEHPSLAAPTLAFVMTTTQSANKAKILTQMEIASDTGSEPIFLFEMQRIGGTNVSRPLFAIRNNTTARWQIDAAGNVDGFAHTWNNFVVGSSVTGIINANIAAGAAIAFSKLASLTSGNILVGSAGNVPTSVTMSGDAVIIADGTLTVADNAITLAKMAGGTDGNLITYDTSGDPAFVATGTSGQVLTSNGAGTAPTFQAAGAASLPVVDTTSIAEGSADATKEVRFEVDGNSTGVIGVLATAFTTAKTVTFPDATDTLVGLATTDTLTNKTLTTPTITSTGWTNATHAHAAANSGSQLVATNALTATGTKDSTTFLRGDDTWAVPGGSGSGVNETIVKQADQNEPSDATLHLDNDLVTGSLAAGTYSFECMVHFESTITPDFKYSFGGTATYSGTRGKAVWTDSSATTEGSILAVTTIDISGGVRQPTVFVKGIFTVTVAGTFGLTWAQNTSDSADTIVLKGSTLTVKNTSSGGAGPNLRRGMQVMAFEFTDANPTDVVVGNGVFYFKIDSSLVGDLIDVNAEVHTAGVTGTTTIQVHNVTKAQDMLSTLINIDTTETASEDAATQPVINTSNDGVALNDLIRVDVDTVQTGTVPKGLIVTLGFRLP